jgi:hypothetical protein
VTGVGPSTRIKVEYVTWVSIMEPHVLHMQLHLAHEARGTFRAEQRHRSQRDLAFGAFVSVRGP